MKVNIELDFNTLFEQLPITQQTDFVRSHLCLLDVADIEPYVEEMGFNITSNE